MISPRGRLAERWFAPKRFESERLYQRLGVRLVKTYIPTGGTFWNRLLWHRLGWRLIEPGSGVEGLIRYEQLTRDFETIHLTAFLGLSALALSRPLTSTGSWHGFAAAMIPILLITIHPVMLQRYNRLRLRGLIDRYARRQWAGSAGGGPLRIGDR